MKHFAEFDTPTGTMFASFDALRLANAAARDFVIATRLTATAYSHNKEGHAIRRTAFRLNRKGKIEACKF